LKFVLDSSILNRFKRHASRNSRPVARHNQAQIREPVAAQTAAAVFDLNFAEELCDYLHESNGHGKLNGFGADFTAAPFRYPAP
jgi:hypothetical protein